MTIHCDYREDARQSLDAAAESVRDALFALERSRQFVGRPALREAVERVGALLSASAVLVRTAAERRRVG